MVKKMHRDAVVGLLCDGACDTTSMLESTGWPRELLDAVLFDLKKRVVAVPLVRLGRGRSVWESADSVIARCPWSAERVLQAVGEHEPAVRVLAKMAGSPELVMRTVLLRLQREKKITTLYKKGRRSWVLASRPKHRSTRWPVVTDDQILEAISAQQPVKLIQLSEQFGRGEAFLARRIGVMRRAGLVRHDVMGDSWRFTLMGYENPAREMRQKIALRCRDVGGDCLGWDGARNQQGKPVVKSGGNTRRVDIVLWTVVHGLKIKSGHTLVEACETKGCCNHKHHKQVTISDAMRRAYADHPPAQRAARNARLRSASSGRRMLLTPEMLSRVLKSPESAVVLAREFGCSPQVIRAARRGDTYRNGVGAAPVAQDLRAHPFDGLLVRAA